MAPPPGLRERKKQRTRETIVHVAMSRFAEAGFEGTTIADIAAEAEIAPRTFFSYFPSKEDLLFADAQADLASLRDALDHRGDGVEAIDALRAWLVAKLAEPGFDEEHERLRRRLIDSDRSLQAHERQVLGYFEDVLTDAFAADLGTDPGALEPRVAAAAAVAALNALSSHFKDDAAPPSGPDEVMAILDPALRFLRAGVLSLSRE